MTNFLLKKIVLQPKCVANNMNSYTHYKSHDTNHSVRNTHTNTHYPKNINWDSSRKLRRNQFHNSKQTIVVFASHNVIMLRRQNCSLDSSTVFDIKLCTRYLSRRPDNVGSYCIFSLLCCHPVAPNSCFIHRIEQNRILKCSKEIQQNVY